MEHYGYCWQPRGVDPEWRPYTDGYWSYTDAGWTWVSYEDFGSITYHYGRWIRLEDAGWVWRPGYEWGPAWVSWRQGDDCIGWAPLPPEADFDPESGIGVWVDRDYDIGPSAYVFCEYRHFGAPVIRNYILPPRRNVFFVNHSVNITNITFVSGGGGERLIFNGGLDYRRISERSEHRIEVLQLLRQRDGDWAQHHRSEFARKVGSQLIVNAPEVEVPAPQTRFAPSQVSREIHAPKVDKGWMGVSGTAEREQIKQRYHEQTQGLTRTSAPARPVDLTQVQTMIGNETRARQQQQQPALQTQPQPTAAEPTPRGDREKKGLTQKLQQQQQAVPVQQATPTPAAAEASVRAAREQQEQAQKLQQQQQTAAEAAARAAQEQSGLSQKFQKAAQAAKAQTEAAAAEASARAAREQQEQTQKLQQQQATQAAAAAEASAHAARQQQQAAQAQPQEQPQHFQGRHQQSPEQVQRPAAPQAPQAASSPESDDHKKKHKDRDDQH